MNDDLAIVCSTHVNALGIAQSLRAAGWNGAIFCMGARNSVAGRYPGICDIWETEDPPPGALRSAIERNFGHTHRKFVFFTTETHLREAARDREAWRAAGLIAYTGVGPQHMSTVLHRGEFYGFIERLGLAAVPVTSDWRSVASRHFVGPCRARVWQSWDEGRKLPRGMNILSSADWDVWQTIVAEQNLRPDQWGLQELLSTSVTDAIGIGGWHDAERQVYVAAARVYQEQENGMIVQRVHPPPGAYEATKAVLDALAYEGPFELEIIVDRITGGFKVLELNPRFWMQHTLTAAVCENALVKLYLGMVDEAWKPQVEPLGQGKQYWVETGVVLPQLLRLRHLWLLGHLRQCVWSTPPVAKLKDRLRKFSG